MLGDLTTLALHADRAAILTRDGTWSRAQIIELANQYAAKVNAQNGAGSAYLVPFDNPVDFLAVVLGLHMAGATAVPCRQDALADLDYIKDLVGPKGVIRPGLDIELFDTPQRELRGDLILLTTGSTGAPKGVVLDLAQVVMNSALSGDRIGIKECDYWCVEVDLSFTSGLCHLLMAWVHKVPFYYIKDLDKAVLNAVFADNNAGFGGSPIQLSKLTDYLDAGSAPCKMMCSGDFLPTAYIDKIFAKFPDVEINKF